MDIRKYNSAGFTLLELIIAVVIASILIAIVVPGFGGMLNRNRMASSVNDFVASLVLARSEAIKREKWVTLCPSSDGRTCVPDYTKWDEGYIVFVNTDRDKVIDDDEQIVAIIKDQFNDIVVQTSSDHRNVITYRPDGRAWSFNTTIRFCMLDDPENNRAVIISPNGRYRLSNKIPGERPVVCD